MGLLEEAIREHLELQRRSGADPSRIALAEQEALEPLVPGQTPAWAEGPLLFDHQQPSGPPAPAAGASATAVAGAQPDVHAAGSEFVEQETAELDMSTVLGELTIWADRAPPSAPGVPDFGPVRARRIVPGSEATRVAGAEAAGTGEDGDFEWEVPDRTAPAGAPQASPRQGSFAFE